MKTLPLFLSILLPIIAFAEAPRHVVLPGIQFGMPPAKAREAFWLLANRAPYRGTMALRHHLITNATLAPGKLASLDKDIPMSIGTNSGPALSTIWVDTLQQPAEGYESVHSAWLDFKDIADSKFKHVGTSLDFPAVSDFGGESKKITTDSWEAEGMHIDLVVYSIAPTQLDPAHPFPVKYVAALRITEITPSSAK